MNYSKAFRILFFVSTICFSFSSFSQRFINYEIEETGTVHMMEGVDVPKQNSGYSLWLPKKQPKGMIVFTHAERDSSKVPSLVKIASKSELAVLYIATANRLEFLFDKSIIQDIESTIFTVSQTHKIPLDNLLYCGFSLEGTRAFKLAMFANTEQSIHKIKPKAIAAIDSPLDMVRYYKSCSRAARIQFNDISANEGMWVSNYLKDNLGGIPTENLEKYIQYSPYSFWSDSNENLSAFKDIVVRTYSEPDVLWWMKTRRIAYMQMNAVDMAGIVNELNLIGNEKSEFVPTTGKGYRPSGDRHPHSWSIVDEADLIQWFTSL